MEEEAALTTPKKQESTYGFFFKSRTDSKSAKMEVLDTQENTRKAAWSWYLKRGRSCKVAVLVPCCIILLHAPCHLFLFPFGKSYFVVSRAFFRLKGGCILWICVIQSIQVSCRSTYKILRYRATATKVRWRKMLFFTILHTQKSFFLFFEILKARNINKHLETLGYTVERIFAPLGATTAKGGDLLVRSEDLPRVPNKKEPKTRLCSLSSLHYPDFLASKERRTLVMGSPFQQVD